MAASKEALAIVLDVGPGMNQAPAGQATDLETSIEAINMVLQRKMFSQSKDEIALVLIGTAGTANDLADGESYENITLAQPLGMVSWDILQYIQNDIQPSNVSGDFLDGMVVAMDHLVKGIQGKKGFATKRMILFSNLSGEFGDDQLDDIIAGMKEAEVELNVIGPKLDTDGGDDSDSERPGPSNGHHGHVKQKTPQQLAGEALMKHVLENVEGESYSFSEALPALSYFQSRQVRSVAWRSNLTIGNNLQIPVGLYNRIKEAKASTFKNVYAKDTDADLERLRTYHLNDEEETEIEKSDVVDGHRYGSTLVPFSEDDKDAMKYKSDKGFRLLCFTKNENVKRHMLMGDATWVCLPEKGDEAAAVALSAMINAMYETNTVAVVRRVYSNNTQVRIGCLLPHIKADYECLIYNELPFSEDVRLFTFGSLPVSEENTAANKKVAPTDEQLSLMDDLIDNMDLTTANKADDDDDGDTSEALKPKLTFNPYLQRLYQCLQHRALNPDDPLPQLSEVVASYLKPPAAVEVQCGSTVEKMQKKYKLELIAKEKKDDTGQEMFKNADEADGKPAKKIKLDEDDDLQGGMADLVKAKVTEVGTVTPVDDFKALIGSGKFVEACKMMQKRISQLVMDSFGTQFYSKAMDCLKAFRKESIKSDDPIAFNDFLSGFKNILSEKGRQNFWDEIVEEKVSLISKLESERSKVSKREADDFLNVKEEVKEPEPAAPHEEVEDLLDDM